jgi:hypothetical protein
MGENRCKPFKDKKGQYMGEKRFKPFKDKKKGSTWVRTHPKF